MTSASIQRRLRNLETECAQALMPEYPPLTPSDIAEIKRKWCAGEELTRVELHRIEKQTPIIDGEFLIGCYRGQLTGKRYIGIDVATAI